MPWADNWELSTAEPRIVLLDADGGALQTIDLDLGFPGETFSGRVEVRQRFAIEYDKWTLADNRKKALSRGVRYHAQIWYPAASSDGRSLLAAVLNHLKNNLPIKFYPRRDKPKIWYLCTLDGDADIDSYPEGLPVGYECSFELESVYLLPEVPTKLPSYITDFTSVGLAYNVSDRVLDFASTAAVYLATDKPGYFSSQPSKGNPLIADLG